MKGKKLILTVTMMFLLFSGPLRASNQAEHLYYVPHVVSYPEFYPANHAYTNLWVISTRDGTNFEIDQDGDGIYEGQFTGLPAGAYELFSRRNWPAPYGILSTGASVRSQQPLQLVLRFGENHFGTYDSGFLTASVLPVDMWGDTFVVPANSTYLYIFAASDTLVNITPPGQPTTTQTITGGTNLKLANVSAGTTVTADNSIYLLGVNCQSDQNFPWMYNVLPESLLGKDYYHDSTYGEVDGSWTWPTNPNLWVTAVNDSTNVYIDEDKDNLPEYTYYLNKGESFNFPNPVRDTHIWSDQNVYVVYVENWASPFRGKYGGAASEYIPTSSYGTDYALFKIIHGPNLPDTDPHIFIIAAENNTHVDIDFGWDGIDTANTLNKGDTWAVNWPVGKPITAQIQGDKGIQVIFRTDFAHHDHPGVNVAYTAIPLYRQQLVEAAVDIDPDTLNRKSKGKWVTAYIELPQGFDVGDIDIDTVAIVAVDEATLDDPLYAKLKPTSIGDYDSDGIPDLMVKFDRKDFIDALTPGNRLITLSGELTAGNTFQGNDTIKVIH
jgi:hypothetical protein